MFLAVTASIVARPISCASLMPWIASTMPSCSNVLLMYPLKSGTPLIPRPPRAKAILSGVLFLPHPRISSSVRW